MLGTVLRIADFQGLPLERLQVYLDEFVERGAKLANAPMAEEFLVDQHGTKVAPGL